MTLTVEEFFELIEGWFCLLHKHKHRKHKKPPAAVRNLIVVVRRDDTMSTGTLTWTHPTVRTDVPPTALALSEIAFVDVFDMSDADPTNPKIGSVAGPFVDPTASFVTGDLAVGNHSFTVVTQDTLGHRSDPSNVATASIAAVLANPAAVTDLTFTMNP